MTSKALLSGNFGCGSTGMPRPLSRMVTVWSAASFHLDAGGVAGDGLVHGIVEDFRDQVVQRTLVGAADIHAGALADGFQPFEHLDGGGVIGGRVGCRGQEIIRHVGGPIAALSCVCFAPIWQVWGRGERAGQGCCGRAL